MKRRIDSRWVVGMVLVGFIMTPATLFSGLRFDGKRQYVNLRGVKHLGASRFTVETWFNWTGKGQGAPIGTERLKAIPLVTKFTAQPDGDRRDGNYFLGIQPGTGYLVADFEEGEGGSQPGRNHPVTGRTSITTNTWHHAAATYDGTNWNLYLDGALEATLTVGEPPRANSLLPAALATTLKSTARPQGFFAGILDEVRIWNYARSASQIEHRMNQRIVSERGLIGRWALNETAGDKAGDTGPRGMDGKLVNRPVWVHGYRASEDVIAPIKLMAIDPIRTERLRQAEARRVPVFFRYDPAVARQVEKNFRTAFILTREQFMAALHEKLAGQSLDAALVRSEPFVRLVADFQKTNPGFPVDPDLARRWALGQSEAELVNRLVRKLNEAMAGFIRSDQLPRGAWRGPGNTRLVTINFSAPAPSLEAAIKQSQIRARKDVLPLKKARTAFRNSFPAGANGVASYLTQFLKPNCEFDMELTQQSRAKRSAPILAADQYQAGDVIVRKGQIITARIQAVLDELEKGTGAQTLEARAAVERIKAEAARERVQAQSALTELGQQTALAQFKSELFSRQNRWLFLGLAALVVVLMLISLAVWRLSRPKPVTMLPAPVTAGQLPPIPEAAGTSVVVESGAADAEASDWQARALSAERRADKTSEVLRSRIFPHFLRWLKQKLFRRLVEDRAHLLDAQKQAELDVAQLEKRLGELQAPLEQRLRAYETRIQELEQELALKGQENCELIQAKIELTRLKLATERGKGSLQNN